MVNYNTWRIIHIINSAVVLLKLIYQSVITQGALVKERTSALYNAQRKIKVLKQQAEQKELHMSLQRQKVSALEERISRLTQVSNMKWGANTAPPPPNTAALGTGKKQR